MIKEKHFITIKLHGPLDTFVINPQELKAMISAQAEVLFSESNNIPGVCIQLAEDIRDQYLNGNDLVWVEVEIYNRTNNLFFGATAERVLVDTPG
jgi:hypothetical protein